MKIVVIDNYDSFVYNICDYVGRLNSADIVVHRNDALSVDEVLGYSPDGIIVSPGPGTPEEAGISIELIRKAGAYIPLLGVCLGHQAIAAAYGGRVVRAERILHGKTSMINHNDKGLFAGLKNPFEATRYHSLIVEQASLPESLNITATTDADEIMGIEHKQHPVYGVQFHPESILTDEGMKLIGNYIDIVRKNGILRRDQRT
ncbi:MAG: aminodeoxychorismate/anthranilate synthase component II [Elusimicrobiota bacterium]